MTKQTDEYRDAFRDFYRDARSERRSGVFAWHCHDGLGRVEEITDPALYAAACVVHERMGDGHPALAGEACADYLFHHGNPANISLPA